MRYGIALLGERVSPRSTYADSLLVVSFRGNRSRRESSSDLAGHTVLDLAKALADNRVHVLVCGGISREERDYLTARRLDIIDNVAASVDEILAALEAGRLRAGFGLDAMDTAPGRPESTVTSPSTRVVPPGAPDCLACRDRVCLRGEVCDALMGNGTGVTVDSDTSRILDAAMDISFESERTLCRLSELIYFCLEMRYHRIGLAYCIELEEPAGILARVLRRFFAVYPVCCKVGGTAVSDPLTTSPSPRERSLAREVACNPAGQAAVLNRIETDLNVMVGLCMGADCVFTHYSEAPVTTLFVKDKSLANNPIGAVYSDYYLKEALQAARCGSGEDTR